MDFTAEEMVHLLAIRPAIPVAGTYDSKIYWELPNGKGYVMQYMANNVVNYAFCSEISDRGYRIVIEEAKKEAKILQQAIVFGFDSVAAATIKSTGPFLVLIDYGSNKNIFYATEEEITKEFDTLDDAQKWIANEKRIEARFGLKSIGLSIKHKIVAKGAE